jgi:hypothetical protein
MIHDFVNYKISASENSLRALQTLVESGEHVAVVGGRCTIANISIGIRGAATMQERAATSADD